MYTFFCSFSVFIPLTPNNSHHDEQQSLKLHYNCIFAGESEKMIQDQYIDLIYAPCRFRARGMEAYANGFSVGYNVPLGWL